MPNSSFGGHGFDWDFGTPNRELKSGVTILSGQVIVHGQADLDWFFANVRPVNIHAAGDPSAGGTAWVDHFGPDPSQPLITRILVPNTTFVPVPPYPPNVYQPMQYTAILSDFKRTRSLPGAIHFCNAEFTVLDAGVATGPQKLD